MFNAKIYLVIGALFLVNITIVSAGECEGCKADSFIDMMDNFDQKRLCWISTKYKFLINIQLTATEVINNSLVLVHDSINQLVDDKCKTKIEMKSCQMTDKYELSQCLMDNMKTLSYNYRDQEKCHGKAFNFAVLDLVFGQISGYLAAQIEIQPEC